MATIRLSAKKGEGMAEWIALLAQRRRETIREVTPA
jgi:hypothetical protein